MTGTPLTIGLYLVAICNGSIVRGGVNHRGSQGQANDTTLPVCPPSFEAKSATGQQGGKKNMWFTTPFKTGM